jgi:transglutaminase-like putative cysteine protease
VTVAAIEAGGARSDIVLAVEHETHYRYGAPVELAQHMAFLRPIDDRRQHVEAFALEIDPPPAHSSDGRDRFGNARRLFTAAGAHHELRVCARSRVRLHPRERVDPAHSPPWEALRERLTYRAGCTYEPATEFAVPSPYVPRLEALRELALRSFTPGRPAAEAALDLMHRIHADFTYETASTTVETPLAQVLRERRGVCQDFAHVLIGACRMIGLAARYVSGYLLTQPPPGVPLLIGADASHAWAAVWCPAGGAEDWLELDPTNDVVPDLDHVRVAVGRDFGDVAPLRGVIRGGGAHDLAVRVTTRRWPWR